MLTSIIGNIGSVFLIISMCFNTKTLKGTILLRTFNLLCCIMFIIYGSLLVPKIGVEALPTLISNGVLFFVNVYFLVTCKKVR